METGNLLHRAQQLHQSGQFAAAEAAYRQILAQNARETDAVHGLGTLALGAGKFKEAVAFIEQAIAQNPNPAVFHMNLGVALHSMGQLEPAAQAYRQAIARRADYGVAYSNLAQASGEQGLIAESLACYERAVQLDAGNPIVASNRLLSLHYDPAIDAATLFTEHKRWNDRFAPKNQTPAPRREPRRPLRVGYVSADYRRHSVSYFFAPLLEHHDRQAFLPYCYCALPRSDEMTAHLRKLAHGWRDVYGVRDIALADFVRADGIDILVDLSGHTGGNRLTAFARRLAPVQVTYLGYPNTTGLAAMDYRLTDAIADPPGLTDSLHAEKLMRLPTCAWCFSPWPDAPQPRERDSGPITFGCFNTLRKINPPTLDRWATLLQRAPDSRLLLKSTGLAEAAVQKRLRDHFEQRGIAGERIEMHGYIESEREHMALYHRVDIALDTFPYHGTTTTCQTLWMGVPVITLAGNVHMSRVGISLLNNVGLPEFAAQNEEQYIEIALNLSKDLDRLKDLRLKLRPRMAASPLMDGPRFTREIEAAYTQMWQGQ